MVLVKEMENVNVTLDLVEICVKNVKMDTFKLKQIMIKQLDALVCSFLIHSKVKF
jgi:hypothetical protein